MFVRFLNPLLLSAWIASAAVAQDDALDARLQALSQRIDKAQSYANSGGGFDLEELSNLAEELEGVLGEMRQVEREFLGEKSTIEEKFYNDSEELMQMIGFVLTYSSQPAPDFILHPQGAKASVEANLMVASMMSELEADLGEVAQDLKEWRKLSVREVTLKQSATSAFNELNALRDEIIDAQDAKDPVAVTREPMVLDALFAVSENLDEFVVGLGQIEMDNLPETQFSMEANKGQLRYPVSGPSRTHRNGVEIITDDSFVTAPVTATVRFSANFLEYGSTLILEPEKDYLIVLAGLEKSAVKEGDLVKKGDVIGFMPAKSDENASSPLPQGQKALYVETRYKTLPVSVSEYFRENEN